MPDNTAPPRLSVGLNLPQAIWLRIGKTILVPWLAMQAVQISFTALYGALSVNARNFMFGDFIEWWERYGEGLLSFKYTSWLRSIPMWWEWEGYIAAAVFLVVLAAMSSGLWSGLLGKVSMPEINMKQKERVQFDDNYSETSAPSDEFDPSKFNTDETKSEKPDDFSRAFKETQNVQDHQDEKPDFRAMKKRLKIEALANDPRTPEGERNAAKQVLKALPAPSKKIGK